ncbi:MAG: ABC transporter ATP-binding protein, partial [Fibrobacterales bacterium]|nr:ABC transporter ATP-binding protein [Fibrobacterales bacterium]
MSREVLKIEGLRIGAKTDSGVRELTHGTDLSVREGEFFALVGESGSGKTITAQAALGFLPQPGGVRIAGRAELDGRDLFALPEDELRKIRGKEVGLVFQEPSAALDPLMRVGRQLKEAFLLHAGPEGADERVRATLRAVELPERTLDAWPHELSGGMQQ